MKLSTGIITLSLSYYAYAAIPLYGRCGGNNYNGNTTCVSGASCTVLNDWYYQCLPNSEGGSSSTSTTSTSTSTSTARQAPTPLPLLLVLSRLLEQALPSMAPNRPSNSYWIGLTGLSTSEVNQAFSDIAKTGATTVRTGGFNEVTSPNGNYYQSWSGSTPTINTGSSGLANFDNVIAASKANGLHLIVALTNNWADYGGMDVYVKQILGSTGTHDQFYTNSDVKTAYKNYIKAFIGRYVEEPTIMAWELSNERRCKGTGGVSSSSSCNTSTITAWAKEISAYIKSIDSNHFVGLGDEGFYNQPSALTYPYQGSDGINFDANLAISSIDFGIFHSYPADWGQAGNEQAWGTQWIADHATSQTKAGKPVIIEEFGVTSDQATIYTAWLDQVVSSGLAGDLIWQAGSHLSSGNTPNDGYAVYPDGVVYPILTSHAETMKSRA